MDFFRVFLTNPIYEKLKLYSINPPESLKIDPDPSEYFISEPDNTEELPRGVYFFTQIKNQDMEDSELLELALELQKEALWSRYKPEEKLYLRKLFEDNSAVTQLWRPIMAPESPIA